MSELTKNQIRDARSILNRAAYNDIEDLPDRLAQVLQYAPTKPGAPLSDKEWKELGIISGATWIDPNTKAAMHLAINDILAKRNVRKEETVPIDGTLITRMVDANFAASHTPYSYPPSMVEGMAAAARVIADALLGPVTDEERKQFRELVGFVPSVVDTFLYARRVRIESKPKTPEERVRIVPNGSGWAVTLDGDHVYGFGNGTDRKGDAEIYRLGLIEQLKQKEAK